MTVVERTHPRPGVTQLTLTRPESLNSMTAELVQELHDHLDAIAVDPHTAHLGPTQTGFAVQRHIASLIPHLRSLALLDAALATAEQVMGNAPFGIALAKEGMWTALEIPGMQAAIDLENRQQIMASATRDHREAMVAFVERWPLDFTNS